MFYCLNLCLCSGIICNRSFASSSSCILLLLIILKWLSLQSVLSFLLLCYVVLYMFNDSCEHASTHTPYSVECSEPAKAVAKPPCTTNSLTGISHCPIISIRQAEWSQLPLAQMLRATILFFFREESERLWMVPLWMWSFLVHWALYKQSQHMAVAYFN